MDHQNTVTIRLAERYITGELSQQEREEFEQHFFECPECAEEVRLGAQFAENSKAVFRERAERRHVIPFRPSRIREWTAIAACLTVGMFTGYQNLISLPALKSRIRTLETPRVLSTAVLAPNSRGNLVRFSGADGPFIQLSLATTEPLRAPSSPSAAQYECRLEPGVWRIPIHEFNSDGNVIILVPTANLANGLNQIALVRIGADGERPLDKYSFAYNQK
jgi:hypothetical protein